MLPKENLKIKLSKMNLRVFSATFQRYKKFFYKGTEDNKAYRGTTYKNAHTIHEFFLFIRLYSISIQIKA